VLVELIRDQNAHLVLRVGRGRNDEKSQGNANCDSGSANLHIKLRNELHSMIPPLEDFGFEQYF
jgi:hypothetical protein